MDAHNIFILRAMHIYNNNSQFECAPQKWPDWHGPESLGLGATKGNNNTIIRIKFLI